MLFALPFIAIGLFFSYTGFVDPEILGRVNGPVALIGFVGLTFGLAGLLLFFSGMRGWLRMRATQRARDRYQEQPWRFDYPWESTGVSDSAATRVVQGAGGAVLLGVFLVPFVWWAFLSNQAPLPVQIGVSLFLVVWVVVIGTLGYRVLQFFKFGATFLSFSRFPFELGSELAVGIADCAFERMNITLRFIEEKFVDRGTADRRSVSHECYLHYADSRDIECAPGTFAAISFQLPDLPDLSTRFQPDSAIRYWELVVEADLPGIDFRTTFPLPVYAGPLDAVPNGGFGGRKGGKRLASAIGFEAKLVGVPLLLAAIFWLVAPDFARSTLDQAIALAYRGPNFILLSPLPEINSAALGLAEEDGAVWALSKSELARIPLGESGSTQTVLTQEKYRALFGRGAKAYSTLLVRAKGEVWVGGWYGEILRFDGARWSQLQAEDRTGIGRIKAISEFGGDVYLGGRGLWRWEDAVGQLVPVVADELIEGMVVAKEGLLVSQGAELLLFDGSQLRTIVQHTAAITALARAANGELFLGDRNGVARYSRAGVLAERVLAGRSITAIRVATDGRLLVGTLRSGVLLGQGSGWFLLDRAKGLPADHVSDLLLDSTGALWIATYGGGISSISFDLIYAQMGE